MNVLNFVLTYWDVIATVVVIFVAGTYIVVKKRWDLLDQVIFGLVTWAEREYGGSTGRLKIAVVIEKVYPYIPVVLRMFITRAQLEEMINKVLKEAKVLWDKNPQLIEPKALTDTAKEIIAEIVTTQLAAANAEKTDA